jgi:hypothetical protein
MTGQNGHGSQYLSAPLPPDGGSHRDRAIDAQAFAGKQRQREKAHLSVDMRLVVQNGIQQ